MKSIDNFFEGENSNIVITSVKGEYIEEIDFYTNTIKRDNGFEKYDLKVKDPRQYVKNLFGHKSNLWLRCLVNGTTANLLVVDGNKIICEEELKNLSQIEILEKDYCKYIVEVNVQSPFLDSKENDLLFRRHLEPIADYCP